MNDVIETNPSEFRFREHVFPGQFPLESNSGQARLISIHWSWACRKLNELRPGSLEDCVSTPPRPGDVALLRVDKAGFHKQLTTAENRRRDAI